jgi:Tfp pilus assembly protein PilN
MVQGLAIIGAFLALFNYLTYRNAARVREDADIAARNLSAAQAQLTLMAERAKPTQKDKNLDEAIKVAENRLHSSQQILDFVNKGDLGNTEGYAEYFRAFSRRATPGVWLTSFTVGGGNTIEIQGRTLEPKLVPAYLAALHEESLFKGKSFGSLELKAAQVKDDKNYVASKGTADLSFVEFTLKSSDAVDRLEQVEGKTK